MPFGSRDEMQLGLVVPQQEIGTDPELITDWARAAEANGFSYLDIFDHVLGADVSERPDWTGVYTHRHAFHEPFVLLSYLAGQVGLDLATGVLVLPQRQAALVAKQAAALDVISGGRLRLGVGIGWNRVEYEALGSTFDDRATRYDEQIELLRRLWADPVVTFDGEYHRVDRAGIAPRPARGSIPLWLGGGTAPAVLRRVGRLGDGWIVHDPHPGQAVTDGQRVIAAAAEAAGRDPSSIGLQGRIDIHGRLDRDRLARSLDRWRTVGATHVSVHATGQGDAAAHIELIPTLAELAGLAPATPSTPAQGAPMTSDRAADPPSVPAADPPSVPATSLPLIHPFVALMKRYAIDYTNSHDQTIYPELFVDDYTVNIGGVALVRDESYGPAVRWLYDRAPGLGLVVHELVLNGDRLCMRFSEHASMPVPGGGRALSCWRGIGMYAWNGERLVSNWVEQDFLSRRRQLETGEPDVLEPPHLDPWVSTVPVPPDAGAEEMARAAVVDDRLHEAAVANIDDSVGDARPLVVEPTDVTFNDSFSAGRRVAVHATVRGSYRGGVLGIPDQAVGREASLQVVALVDVAADGTLGEVRAVTDREGVRAQLRAAD